jgi:hypothetical protein
VSAVEPEGPGARPVARHRAGWDVARRGLALALDLVLFAGAVGGLGWGVIGLVMGWSGAFRVFMLGAFCGLGLAYVRLRDRVALMDRRLHEQKHELQRVVDPMHGLTIV